MTVRVRTRVETASWTLTADSDSPDIPPDPRTLVGPLVAQWSTDVLPPVAQPSAVTFGIYDDGSNPLGILPVDVGDPIGVNVTPDSHSPLVTFRGRVADVSAVPYKGGGVILRVIATDWLADLAGIGAKRKIQGSQYSVTGVGGLFLAYDQIADNAGITFDYHVHETNATPLYRDFRDADLSNLSVLDALSRYVAHDIRGSGKVSRYLQFEVDPASTTPTAPTYSLREYDPRGISELAGVLELDYSGGVYSLIPSTDYYTGIPAGTGILLDASNLAFDPTEWRKSRLSAINTVDLNGLFSTDSLYPSHVGAFNGASGSAGLNAISPNLNALPADIQNGDWLYCMIYAATATISEPIVPPAGWTQFGNVSPQQSAATVRSWCFKKRATTADAGTTPTWTLAAGVVPRWVMIGGVVRNSDGPAIAWGSGATSAVVSSAVTFATAIAQSARSLAVLSAGARWGTASTSSWNVPAGYTEQISFQDPVAGASDRMGATLITKRIAAEGDSLSPTTTVSVAANNGSAFSIVFTQATDVSTVRRDYGGLVAQVGRNSRTLDSALWYTDDAKAVGDVLLGEESQIPTGYGLQNVTIAWETLTADQADAISLLLWPKDEAQVMGRPVAIVGIPDDWNLSGSPAVFGRLMGVETSVAGDQIRVGLTLRAVAPITAGGITYTEAAVHAPTWTIGNSDPSITLDQLTLVKD